MYQGTELIVIVPYDIDYFQRRCNHYPRIITYPGNGKDHQNTPYSLALLPHVTKANLVTPFSYYGNLS